MSTDFPGAFAALREILKKHSDGMIVHSDKPNDFAVITPATGPNGKPMWFAAVMLKKSAVSYHFMPLYYNPKLQASIAPELLPRKQGKCCFNFKRPDPELLARIDELTARGRASFEKAGFLQPGKISPEMLNEALRAAGENPEKIAKIRKKTGKAAAAKRAATIARRTNKRAALKAH